MECSCIFKQLIIHKKNIKRTNTVGQGPQIVREKKKLDFLYSANKEKLETLFCEVNISK